MDPAKPEGKPPERRRYDEGERVREQIAYLMPGLGSVYVGVRENALVQLVSLGPAAVPVLSEVLTVGSRGGFRAKSFSDLSPFGTSVSATEPILRALGMIASPDAVPALREFLERQKPASDSVFSSSADTTMQACAEALGKIGTREALVVLVQNLDKLGSGFARAGLEWFGDEGVAALPEALQDSGADQRRVAAKLLGSLEDKRAVPGLVALLGDTDERVVAAAAEALEEIGDPGAVTALRERLRSTAPKAAGEEATNAARPRIIGALASLGGPAVVPDLLDEALRGDREARSALVGLGSRAIPRLADALKTGNPSVQKLTTAIIADIQAGESHSR